MRAPWAAATISVIGLWLVVAAALQHTGLVPYPGASLTRYSRTLSSCGGTLFPR